MSETEASTGSRRRGRHLRTPLMVACALVACALFTMVLPPPVQAQSGGDGFLFRTPVVQIGLRAGLAVARANSQIFDFTTDELTLNRSDFNAFQVGGDVGFRVADQFDIVASVTYASTSKQSEFRDYLDQDDLPIEQRTTFTRTPLTLAGRFYLTPRGRQVGRFVWVPARVSPYVGAGGGMVHYSFRQVGSFVDFVDLSIFDTTFESGGWTPLGMIMAGVDYSLSPHVVLNLDGRYQFATADLQRDFTDFNDGIDLSGLQLSFGVHFRL